MNYEDSPSLLIKGATVLLPGGPEETDVACRDGRIVAIGDPFKADTTLHARGLHLLPGAVDSQVHFREPGMTHKETLEAGTRGAVLGGITSVFEMPNTQPLTLRAEDLQTKIAIAERDAWCNYAFYIGGSAANAEQLAELECLPACSGVKIFMGSSFGDLLADSDNVLRNILRHGRRRVAIHAEDEARLRARRHLAETAANPIAHPVWRDEDSALLATRRIVALAAEAGRPLHVLHISTAEEMAFLQQHKSRVSVEVLPQHLTLSAPECYERLGTLAQMNPPIRDQRHQDALWKAVRNGIVDVIGSDHAPHTREEKQRSYPDSPSGMTGTQTLLPLMLNHVNQGRLSLSRLVDMVCAGPARLFGMAGKGRIAVGYDADLTLVDMQRKQTVDDRKLASPSGWSAYDGMMLQGWPSATIIGGQIVMTDEEAIGMPSGKPINFLSSTQPAEPNSV
ncbi:dihydroorotase [Alcanivorax sp.]|uniref:dihydroorotase n=1 Tax=Alcanivorax sp. TaxID=1872427 RepID=UPI000C5D2138|nr:dihydroorotase [Alcanivorax sp.]MBQ23991.1 dihydroorotase [Alcanivorax sp.]